MKDRVLVTYASKCGSTGEVATAIGEELCGAGLAVDVLPIRQVTDLGPYRAIVLGSAVRFGRWLGEATEFVQKNGAALGQVPLAFFTVHIMNLGDDESSVKARTAYLDPIRAIAHARTEAFFAGMCDAARLSFFEKTIGRLVKSPEGDFRDWDKIRGWARGLPTVLEG